MMQQKARPARKTKASAEPAVVAKKVKHEIILPQVDKACKIANATVYSDENNMIYSVVLNQTDIKKNNNKYYKIQLIQDNGTFHIFRGWGRVGYDGQSSLHTFSTAVEAMKEFSKAYKDKTKNTWNTGEAFVKYPGKYHLIEVDVEATNKALQVVERQILVSMLKPKVQELMKMLFDVGSMTQTMLDFQLDTAKLPLGRLTKKQMLDAFQVLTDLSNVLAYHGDHEEFVEASNRFYTLMPHNFGMNRAPVIDTREMIEQKRDMLDNMIQIEVAYNMMKAGDDDEVDGEKKVNPLDSQYNAMKIKMEPMEHDSADFDLINKYLINTHAATHANYSLKLEEVFEIEREGEKDRYKPYAKLHNRQLLWHGSRKTNFAGILANGLKIAPKEAPVTGYMFGKGIYFADMSSKSANYCCTTPQNPIGLMLLNEVALGDTHDLKGSSYIEKLPKGKNSVKGLGKTQPNPKDIHKLDDGVIVPMGKPVTDNRLSTSLLYNEYIVYDPAQVNLKYLLKVKFNYKR